MYRTHATVTPLNMFRNTEDKKKTPTLQKLVDPQKPIFDVRLMTSYGTLFVSYSNKPFKHYLCMHLATSDTPCKCML